jgi:hypothetical protein
LEEIDEGVIGPQHAAQGNEMQFDVSLQDGLVDLGVGLGELLAAEAVGIFDKQGGTPGNLSRFEPGSASCSSNSFRSNPDSSRAWRTSL